MTIYQVTVERRHYVTYYVDADSREEADERAEELACEFDFPEEWDGGDDDDVDVYEVRSRTPVDWELGVWFGGPDGYWVFADPAGTNKEQA